MAVGCRNAAYLRSPLRRRLDLSSSRSGPEEGCRSVEEDTNYSMLRFFAHKNHHTHRITVGLPGCAAA